MRSAVPVLLVSIFACGGRDPAPAPPPDPTPTSPTTPTPPTTTPPSPTTPTTPAAPTTPTSSPTPTSPAAPTSPSSPSAPAGPTSIPPSATIQRLDASAECDGLVPATVPAPVTISRTPPTGATCAGGLSDGTGHVAVAARSQDLTLGQLSAAVDLASWQVFAPDGSAGATFSAWPVVAQAAGWQGLSITAAPDGVGVVVAQVALGADGGLVKSTVISEAPALVTTSRWSLGGDPLGGSFALLTGIDRYHNHWSVLRAQRLDAAGAPRWPDPIQFGARSDRVLFLTAGVSRQGEALAVWQQSAYLDVSWHDAAGTEVASAEMLERYPDVLGTEALDPVLELVPLLDGALALRAQGSFRRVYPRLATRSAPLPTWLADRAAWSLRFTRGNAGYALLPPAGQASPDCTQAVELRAPSGRLCGQVILLPEQPGACTTGAVDQGWDGTVVQQSAQGACSWRFWPGLLAR